MIRLKAKKGDCSILEHRCHSPKGVISGCSQVLLVGRSTRRNAGSEVVTVLSRVPKGGFVQILDSGGATKLG